MRNTKFMVRAREIKSYNGKEIRLDNKWIYGYYFEENGVPFIINEERKYKIDPETLCYSTGLYDEGGTLIYENDIVDYDDNDWLVQWSDDDGMFVLLWDNVETNFGNIDSKWCSVIGDVFVFKNRRISD